MDDRFKTDRAGRCTKRHILITGSPGVGKTTLIATVVDRISVTKTGFLTREIREGSVRKGFLIETLDGRTAVLAEAACSGVCRLGKYRVLTESVRTALSGRTRAIATIAARGTPVIEQIKLRPDFLVFEVTRQNRDSIAEVILKNFEEPPAGENRRYRPL